MFRKRYLLIGFIVSFLLSLFVNFSLLTVNYGKLTTPSAMIDETIFEQSFIYFSLIWFFFFTFILFITTIYMLRIGDNLFRRNEYKAGLFAAGVTVVVALLLLQVYPVILSTVTGNSHTRTQTSYPRELSEEEAFIQHFFNIPEPQAQQIKPVFHHRPVITEHLFVLITVILIVILIHILDSRQQMALAYEKLKTENLQSSYNALMGQINPHFFFNSLNGLNSLIRSGEKEQTLTYLDELSNVFRYILQSNKKELVSLAEELEFVKAYTYLLSVRYEGKLFFSIQVDSTYLLWYLPMLSVLPLIENAVKHNVISKQYPLQVDIYTTKDQYLIISNKIQPKVEENERSGIGLKNLWGRYKMLTGKDIQMSKQKEYFKVSLPLLNKPISV
ncbi:sensor histidine kinase YesM [Parabacteroides sp. PF5-9]|nr:histidine kinase [Parabacteroides sp. PF5-9]MDH6358862.1 sensor histidine kinase YesM [Parabacteroides sp. PF5-9]